MEQNILRTYQRRSVTRESGYHTCEETTGGECIILKASKTRTNSNKEILTFEREKIKLYPLFNKNIGILCFGGYVYIQNNLNIIYRISYEYNQKNYVTPMENKTVINENDWNNVGFHLEIPIEGNDELTNVKVEMIITGDITGFDTEFVSFDLDSINKEELFDDTFAESFYQKTNMCIPYLYYLNTELPIDNYLTSNQQFSDGQYVVLKSCNRCGRFLPINIFNELKTLSFSLHCKKLAPCKHSTFSSYTIMNDVDIDDLKEAGLNIVNDKVASYYGHQLECKACKKFFVNTPLNPQRNAQQFKEDGLRRRAIEALVSNLLDRKLVHHEFREKTKKEFTEYIWEKFDKKCFKCGKELDIDEMNLDHTMPLAYLYRLDETATCLCASHNSQKSDHFPVDYYTEDELLRLSNITGLDINLLHSRKINEEVLNLLVEHVVWFYDEFLMQDDYQKIRDGILTADKINDSLKRVINGKVDLAEEYKKITGHYPKSVTIIQ